MILKRAILFSVVLSLSLGSRVCASLAIDDGVNWLKGIQVTQATSPDPQYPDLDCLGWWVWSPVCSHSMAKPSVTITSMAMLCCLNNGSDLNNMSGLKCALKYLKDKQVADGSIYSWTIPGYWNWPPSLEPKKTYETSLALVALVALRTVDKNTHGYLNLYDEMISKARDYLLRTQNLPVDYDIAQAYIIPSLYGPQIEGGVGYPADSTNRRWGGWSYPRWDWVDFSNTQFAAWGLYASHLIAIGSVTPSVGADSPKFSFPCTRQQALRQFADNDFEVVSFLPPPDDLIPAVGDFPYSGGGGGMLRASTNTMGLWALFSTNSGTKVRTEDVCVVADGTYSVNEMADAVNGWFSTYWPAGAFPENFPVTDYNFYWYMSFAKAMDMMELLGYWAPGYWNDIPGTANLWYEDPIRGLKAKLEGLQNLDGSWSCDPLYEYENLATVWAILSLQQGELPVGAADYEVIFNSSVEVYLEDIDGNRTGVINDIKVVEIPNSSCSDPGDEPFEIDVADAGLDVYTIHVKGVDGGGGFTCTQASYFYGNQISELVNVGQVAEDETITYRSKLTNSFGPAILFTNYFPGEVWTIGSTVDIKPETLNLSSKGEFTTFVRLPKEYDVVDIDISTVVCEGATALSGNVAKDTLVVKFDREDLVGVWSGESVILTVTGKLYDGTPFSGKDRIRAMY